MCIRDRDDGVLIAPTFTHAGNSFSGMVKAFFMKLAGFPLHSRWTSEEYLRFLRQNGWTVRKSAVLKACLLYTSRCVYATDVPPSKLSPFISQPTGAVQPSRAELTQRKVVYGSVSVRTVTHSSSSRCV